VRRCIRVQNIFKAMAPSQRQMNMALKQFYFIDSCRTNTADIENEFADRKIGGNKLGQNDFDGERSAPIYFAANAGEPAFSDSHDGTQFGKALLNVLKNSSADVRVDQNGEYVYAITTDSLRVAIWNAMEREVPVRGHVKAADLILRKAPPEIEVSVEIRPPDKAGNVQVVVFNVDNNVLLRTIAPVEPNAYMFKTSVGRYKLEASWMQPVKRITGLPPTTFFGPIQRWVVNARL
jgi:hypothetical protein